jgi:hypothetical protein
MFEIATFTPEGAVQLPQRIARYLSPSDRFVVWLEGDTLHLKKIAPSPLDIVEQAPVGEPLSSDEIDAIVHEVRSRRHQE